MRKELTLFLGITTILFLAMIFPFTNASHVEVIQVNPSSEQMLIINVSSGVKITGSLAISGGSGNDVDFWVTDPLGATILNLGRVNQGATFEFTSQKSGAYTLHFSNTFSLLSSKMVNLTYDVEISLFGIDLVTLLGMIGVILGIVLVILVIVLSRRKGKSKVNPPRNPQHPSST